MTATPVLVTAYALDPDAPERDVWVGPYLASCGVLYPLFVQPDGAPLNSFAASVLKWTRDAWRGRPKPDVVRRTEPDGAEAIYRWPGDFRVTARQVEGSPFPFDRLGVLRGGLSGWAVEGDPYRLRRLGEMFIHRDRARAVRALARTG